MTIKYEKISSALKAYFSENDHVSKGTGGWHQSPEHIAKRMKSLQETIDKKGRKTEAQKKAGNKAGVYAYRARKRNAIPEDADLKLIKRIYENCPEGYHVDHRIALASGGMHHQDNLQYLPISENCRKGKNSSYDESLAIQWKDLMGLKL